ncbi:receptor-type tyrosine-protein phosphatase alpha-like [Ptychodera flava]|uniref:receptor-type tyrosine-protein phosphatase alpha-like n=1 Tax=Ptychodera flava TaxID=63121 RepID=UPI003969BF7C
MADEGLIAALMVVLVLLLLAVILLTLIYSVQKGWIKTNIRCLKRLNYTEQPGTAEGEVTPPSETGIPLVAPVDNGRREIPTTDIDPPPTPTPVLPPPPPTPTRSTSVMASANTLVRVNSLSEYIKRKRSKNRMKEEYNTLPGPKHASVAVGSMDANRPKNRFKNIITYDHSRVVLELLPDSPNSDYINASHIDGYKKEKAYICTQGPKKETINDFWRMVWEKNSSCILMATNIYEQGRERCAPYWPESADGETAYGDIFVHNTREEFFADSVIRTFRVKRGATVREVRQFQYTTWPDMDVPQYPSAILSFLRRINDYNPPRAGPWVVHCSAGVGRSGTFVTIDAMMKMAEAEKKIDIYKFVEQGRKNRPHFVQVLVQYNFIHTVLLEVTLCGITEISATDINIKLKKLKSIDPKTGKSGFQREFENFDKICFPPKPNECESGRLPENINKNRDSSKLPREVTRPFLMTMIDDPTSTDYINASFLQGYMRKDAYIATQMPLPNTIVDFWRMVYDYKSSTIVMLNHMETRDMQEGQYWSDEQVKQYGPFRVEVTSSSDLNTLYTRKIKLTNCEKSEAPRYIQQFEVLNWSARDTIPSSSKCMVDLVTFVEKAQQGSGNNPIVVHCENGLGRSGVFSAIFTTCERVKSEQCFDVFQTVKALRMQRYGMVETLEQYQYIYEVVVLYLDSFATYSNFPMKN